MPSDADFEAWDTPVPSGVLGVKWLLAALHEDVYSLETMRGDAANFYKEFYQIDIDTDLIAK
jgi:iron complex transport system substrate-binding protein